jgi:uncharacterized protein involved in response to NO
MRGASAAHGGHRRFGAARSTLFAYGFRPFFLLAGVFAVLAVPLWLAMYAVGTNPLPGLPAQYWHAHEMLFGLVPAAIAGFLLTAVPSWTGARGFAGRPLMLLCAAWLAGRVAFAAAPLLPQWLVTIAELMFLPALAALLAPPLVRARNRNTPLLAVITLLWCCDAVFLLGWVRLEPLLAYRALRVGIDVILTLITVIGGRIVPSFTANALRRRGQPTDLVQRAWLEKLIVPAMIVMTAIDAWRPDSTLSGYVAVLVATAQALRLLGWQGIRTRDDAILWVLHVGYAWLPIGFALKALWLLRGVPWAAYWLHALTVGGIATMILAVMSRVALGHTGRELHVKGSMAAAYLTLSAAALLRVFGPALAPSLRLSLLEISGALWTVAFAIYLIVYAPILTSPRVDGKAG